MIKKKYPIKIKVQHLFFSESNLCVRRKIEGGKILSPAVSVCVCVFGSFGGDTESRNVVKGKRRTIEGRIKDKKLKGSRVCRSFYLVNVPECVSLWSISAF